MQKISALCVLLVDRGGNSGNFLKLGGKMSNTAVMKLPGNFCEGKLITKDQIFDLLNLLSDYKLFNGSFLRFRKHISEIGIIKI